MKHEGKYKGQDPGLSFRGYLLGLLIFDRVGWLYQYIINTVLDERIKPHYHHIRIKGKFSERSK